MRFMTFEMLMASYVFIDIAFKKSFKMKINIFFLKNTTFKIKVILEVAWKKSWYTHAPHFFCIYKTSKKLVCVFSITVSDVFIKIFKWNNI